MCTDLVTGLVTEDQESIAQKLSHYDFWLCRIVDARTAFTWDCALMMMPWTWYQQQKLQKTF